MSALSWTLAVGSSKEEILRSYPSLTPEDIQAAIAFPHNLVQLITCKSGKKSK
ncbi:MAG TPA: hypothetical protein DCE07_08405 [Peptococcaceae bacterium]|nr:hypothetical protein [Peptococcaceae bacterium]